jgi:Rieske Fe-S protein
MSDVDRRAVLRGVCAGCAGLALAACGSGSGTTEAASPAASPASPASPAAPKPPKPLATLADLVVAKAVSVTVDGRRALLTKVSDTAVVAFSAKCTHQGCTVEPDGAKLACPCHGSVYEATTGKVLRGPAPAPLPAVQVVVRAGEVFAG